MIQTTHRRVSIRCDYLSVDALSKIQDIILGEMYAWKRQPVDLASQVAVSQLTKQSQKLQRFVDR